MSLTKLSLAAGNNFILKKLINFIIPGQGEFG
jgi:hypothetical protein